MRLTIRHETVFRYDTAASYALLQLRMRPATQTGQTIHSWTVDLDGAVKHAEFTDQYGNHVDLVELSPDSEVCRISVAADVETSDQSGVTGADRRPVPLWLFQRETALTKADGPIRDLAQRAEGDEHLSRMHHLCRLIHESVAYIPGQTGTDTTASQALKQASGVCQDHSHIFLSAARSLGIPARYVGGYLMMDDREQQDAGHAWAEAHIEGLGWVGFDVSNGISPDARYVAVARGLDYSDCAPTRGITFGARKEALEVSIQVQQ